MIQGILNFNEINDHNEKNLTITLKAQPSEHSMIGKVSTIHLNFNYTYFQEKYYDHDAQ